MKLSPKGFTSHNSNPADELPLAAMQQSSMPKVYHSKLLLEKNSQIDNETPSFMDTMIINKGESQKSMEKEADGGINYMSSE